MKFSLLIGLLLSFSATAFAKSSETLSFDPAMCAEMKNKNLGEFFCAKPTTYFLSEACGQLKSQKISVNWITPKFGKTYFTISNGMSDIKVSRTSVPTVFEINQKKLDITEYETFKELVDGIGKMLPKTSAQYWVLINAAYAGPTESVRASIAIILTATADADICKAALDIAKACSGIPEKTEYSKGLTNLMLDVQERMSRTGPTATAKEEFDRRGMTLKEREMFDSYVKIIGESAKYLELELAKVKSKEKTLNKCPSAKKETGKTAWSDIVECKATLAKTMEKVNAHATTMLPILKGTYQEIGNVLVERWVKGNNMQKSDSETKAAR